MVGYLVGKEKQDQSNHKEDFYLTVNKEIRHLTVSLEYEGPIPAPIDEGAKIANIIISKKNEVINKIPLYASENIKKVNFFKSLLTSLNYLIWGDV